MFLSISIWARIIFRFRFGDKGMWKNAFRRKQYVLFITAKMPESNFAAFVGVDFFFFVLR